MPNLPPSSQIYDVNRFGLEGLNTYDDPKDIEDIELADVRNMVFENGNLQPRGGSLLYRSKPAGETQNPLQMLIPTTSIGYEYLINVYGNNFWLDDKVNNQWIKLNTTYTPTETKLFYGSTNWNKGIVDDSFYFGNGKDYTMKWQMALNTLKNATTVGGTTLVLNDSVQFPSALKTFTATTISFAGNTISDSADGFLASGIRNGMTILVSGSSSNNGQFTVVSVNASSVVVVESLTTESAGASITLKQLQPIIIQNGATQVSLFYSSNVISTGTITLQGTVGYIIPAGSSVTIPIVKLPSTPKGKVLLVSQGNLFLANYYQGENTINYSRLNDPDSFVITAGDAETAGFYTVYHGKGPIVDMKDFGQYLTIEKQDIILQWVFGISTGGDQTVSVGPIISGDGIGPVSNSNTLNYMNTLYYPTSKQGIISFEPQTTGGQTSSGLNVLSSKINNLVVDILNFDTSRTCGLAQKLYWACSLPPVGVETSVNNIVLMYDLVRAAQNPSKSAWTIYDNWNATDIKPVNNVLYYLSLNDGAVYECYKGYQDAVSDQPIPYTSLALSKRFDLGSPATLMRPQYIYVEGFVSLNTTFYIRVLDNENGSLGSQAYAIAGNNSKITVGAFSGGLARFKLASPVLGGVDLETLNQLQNPLFFRCYLEVSQAFRPHNLQLECFSVAMGSFWSVSTLSLIKLPEPSIETALVLSPSTVPVINL